MRKAPRILRLHGSTPSRTLLLGSGYGEIQIALPIDTSDFHGLHYEYLCGFNRPGRNVPGLPMRLVGLHERADRPWIATKQSRRLAPECRDGAGLDLGLGTAPESRSTVI